MAWLKKCIYTCIGLTALILVIGFSLPSDYRIERSILIEAPPEDIYPNVVNLKDWPKWGVWFIRDPTMQIQYGGPDRAVGMHSTWESESQGSGEMEIKSLKFNKKVVYSLYFSEYDLGSTGKVTLEPVDGGTMVTWVDEGEVGNNPINRYIGLMVDDMIGSDFETGLENLKTVVENQG